MNKTKKINKLGLVLTLVLVIALALVISASATTFVISNLEDISNSGTFANGGYYYVNYDFGTPIVNGNFAYASLVGDYNYTFIIFDIEAFKTRYNGYTSQEFETELGSSMYSFEYLQNMYYSFFYDYSYYGFESSDSMFNHVMSWQPSISQDVYNELQDDYNSLENTFNTLESAFQELQFSYDDLAQRSENAYNTLQGEYNTLQGEYNTLQGEYNTLQDDYTILNDSIPRIRAESKQVGYNEGMRDADAVERGVMSIVGSPMYILTSVFDVEIFGINLLNLITTIMTVIIVAWVIKKLAN